MNEPSILSPQTIDRAAEALLDASPAGTQVILFGSYGRGTASPESDVDFLVVEPTLPNRRAETVRLRGLLRPLGIPADVLVVSRSTFDAWKLLPNNVVSEAYTEGRVYEHAG